MDKSFTKINGCINTYSGIKFNLLNPTPDMVNIHDIAKGLAYKSHFGGQTPFYFSVAQHSILTHELMFNDYYLNYNQPIEIMEHKKLILALMHDAAEAYIGDMLKPLKVHLPLFCEVEDKIMKVICEKFELDFDALPEIKKYDIEAQSLEYNTFYNDKELVSPLTPDESYKKFLSLFYSLIKLNSYYAKKK